MLRYRLIPQHFQVLALRLLLCTSWYFSIVNVTAQSCPPNIDFEKGTFQGWTCYTGTTAAVGTENAINLNSSFGPVNNRHMMFSPNSGQVDNYGRFPVSCPNGSGYSVRLGNDQGGGQAEGLSYEFTIPANENSYSLIYHYAVVFQAPNHRANEQPRMQIEITNVTDNKIIDCASFTFVAVGTSLPGFQVATNTDTTAVLYKNWSAVTVDLSGNAGKTIRMFFKTADCTFRRHFGYAYIDVDSECSGNFVGATYCPDDTAVNITAPFGYASYTWYDSSLTNVIGASQVLALSPAPASGTTLAVKLVPYDGYGCPKTLYAKLFDTLTVVANAGEDMLSCNQNGVPIGVMPRPGWKYEWTPEEGLSNPTIANPYAAPSATTVYRVKTSNGGGGCKTLDTVVVRASYLDTALQLIGKPNYCIDNRDSSILKIPPAKTMQWYKNGFVINGATQPTLRVTNSGMYLVKLSNNDGCTLSSDSQRIMIDKARPGITYPDVYAIRNNALTLNARPGERVLWSPAFNLSAANSFTPTFLGTSDREYRITITTATECVTIDTQRVKTIDGIEIYVPTAFTPNNDGRNDLLRPIIRGVKQLKYFRIFNRLGNLLFETTEESTAGWNGLFKAAPQSTQTLVWMLEVVGQDNLVYQRKGTTVLLK